MAKAQRIGRRHKGTKWQRHKEKCSAFKLCASVPGFRTLCLVAKLCALVPLCLCACPQHYLLNIYAQEREGFTLFPRENLFKPLMADPREPQCFTKYIFTRGRNEAEFCFGGNFPFFRRGNIQLGIESGAFTRFDMGNKNKFKNVDYKVGFPITFRKEKLSSRFQLYHISSHLGDEWAKDTGRKKIDYSREVAEFLLSYDFSPNLRLYGGPIYVFHIKPDYLKKNQFQIGAEWVGKPRGRVQYFTAVDLKIKEENDWDLNANLQSGIILKSETERAMRLFFEYFHGHSDCGQFYNEREESWSIGSYLYF